MRLPRAVGCSTPLWVFCLFWAVSAPISADEDPTATEWEKFTGIWQCVGGERGGEALPSDQTLEIRMVFQGNRLTLHTRGQLTTFDVRIDPEPNPKVFIMTARDGSFKGKSAFGIYEWDGEKLRLCIPNRPKDSQEPPKDFDTAHDRHLVSLVFERGSEDLVSRDTPLGHVWPRLRRLRTVGRDAVEPLLPLVKFVPGHSALTKYLSNRVCTEKQCLAKRRS
jgi:uncharacterized protein (TIGR03067 family)